MGRNNHDDEDDDFFDQVSSIADRLGLKGQKRRQYIDRHMDDAGYDHVQTRDSYVRRDDDGKDDDDDAGSRFLGRRTARGNRDGRRRRIDNDDTF